MTRTPIEPALKIHKDYRVEQRSRALWLPDQYRNKPEHIWQKELVDWIVPVGKETSARYPMSENPRLYRDFAAIDKRSLEQILGFAKEWGLFRVTVGQDTFDADPFEMWQREIGHMWQVLEGWDYLSGRADENTYRSLVRESVLRSIAHLGVGSHAWKRQVRGFVAGLIQATVNEKLQWHCGLSVSRSSAFSDKFQIEMLPQSLIGVLWYQAAKAIADRQDHFLCPVCKTRWVKPNDGAGRPRRFCGESCRVLACQRRQASRKSSGQGTKPTRKTQSEKEQ